MKKFNVFMMLILLFWTQICFSEEIPSDYEFQFFDKTTAPDQDDTDFGSGSCTGSCSEKNEVQGITSIGDNYWILSKNKWFYVYKLGNSLFSTSNKKDQIENDSYNYDNHVKFCDIDFFDGHLYVPNGNKIEVFRWNNEAEKFDRNFLTLNLDTDSFGVAIHPYSKHVFFN